MTGENLPNPAVCKTQQLAAGVDYWHCAVEAPYACPYLLKIGVINICSIASKSGTKLKRKIEEKKISVRFRNDSIGAVSKAILGELIESGEITSFERSSGWVELSSARIRNQSSLWQFKGLQKRSGR